VQENSAAGRHGFHVISAGNAGSEAIVVRQKKNVACIQSEI